MRWFRSKRQAAVPGEAGPDHGGWALAEPGGQRRRVLDQPTRMLPIVAPLMTPAAQWRSSRFRPGSDTRPESEARSGRLLAGVRLEIRPEHWWNGRGDGWLIVDVTRVEPRPEPGGGVIWAVVEGWRVLPSERRARTRDLVRAAALPAEWLAGGW